MTILRQLAASCLWTSCALCQLSPSAYVGSQICAGCHPRIAATYRQTGMGRSMATAQGAAMLELARERRQIRNDKLDRTFEVFVTDGKLYQSEYKADGEKILFRTTYPLDFVVGSGEHGFTFITRRDRHLFQTPLSWYSRTRTWDLSPGYEHADYGFNRPIQGGCIACHSGRPQAVSDRNGLFHEPPFRELPIVASSVSTVEFSILTT